MRRRLAFALAPLLLVAACGDDGKVGSDAFPREAPPAETPAPATPAAPPPAAPPLQPPPTSSVPTGWAGTHAGDWATWEVRTAGTEAVTRLTWRATRVDAGRIAFTIESKTTAKDGRTLAETSSEEVHDAATDPAAGSGGAVATKSADVTVSGAKIPTWVHVVPGATGGATVWTSDAVPFSGVVRVSGGTVDQILVGFGRGR